MKEKNNNNLLTEEAKHIKCHHLCIKIIVDFKRVADPWWPRTRKPWVNNLIKSYVYNCRKVTLSFKLNLVHMCKCIVLNLMCVYTFLYLYLPTYLFWVWTRNWNGINNWWPQSHHFLKYHGPFTKRMYIL